MVWLCAVSQSDMRDYAYTCTSTRKRLGINVDGATENAGVENAIRAKLHGWKMQEWKKQE